MKLLNAGIMRFGPELALEIGCNPLFISNIYTLMVFFFGFFFKDVS